MKQLTLLFILVLFMNQTQAQIVSNTTYEFNYAAAIQGDNINHVESKFRFILIDSELYWQEQDNPPMNLGVAYYIGAYNGEEGYAARYQCKEVEIEYARDSHGVAISIIYGNKRITFHNYQGKPVGDIVKL